jgi:DNA-binding transcriptional regulator YiaG
MTPKLRNTLLSEAYNLTAPYNTDDRRFYIEALMHADIWPEDDRSVPVSERPHILGQIYDATHCSVRALLNHYHMSQTAFSGFFCIPLRTVQDWCGGRRKCPSYVITMAAEILEQNKGRDNLHS